MGRWFPNGGPSLRNSEGGTDSRAAMLAELQQKHPDLPCVLVKGIAFEKNEDDLT